MCEWQPIETAPKDGSNVFLYCTDRIDHFAIGYYDEAWFAVGHFRPEPTHWMPLPKPPKA